MLHIDGKRSNTRWDETGYQNLFGHFPIVNSALSPSITFCVPFNFSPLTTVPIFVARSSIVRVERLEGLCDWPGSTGLTVMVKCLREMVLCDIANWPAISNISLRLYSVEMDTYVLLLFGQTNMFSLVATTAFGLGRLG